MRACRLVVASGGLQSTQSTFETVKWAPYLPSITNATNFSIGSFHLLSQITDFPYFLDTRQSLPSQVQFNRGKPFVEVVYDPAYC